MAGPNKKLVAAVESYFADLRRARASGGATGERSYCLALEGLLRAVGATLKHKVFCVQEPADQGAGHPDLALYTARQVQKGRPRPGQVPERGVVEVKGVGDDAWVTAESDQVSRYWDRYRLVLVTNLRDFVLVDADGVSGPAKLETLRLAEDAEDFWRKVETPRAFARAVSAGLGEFLARALSRPAALAEPKDLAWLLASYARDEQEEAGPLFEGHHGPQRFRWREAVWHLRAPVFRALFQRLADPSRLKPLGLVEALDWTSAVLGDTTLDVCLNGEALWRNVPAADWNYRLGGYQVLKKWLSCRESAVLGRRLRADEIRHFTDTARRIGALLLASSDGPKRRPQ